MPMALCLDAGVLHTFSVHSRRSLALIVRHPFHGQGFAGKRAGQQPLQGFHLAPAAFLCCLDDTRLQPSDLTFTLSPVQSVPKWSPCRRMHTRIDPRSFAISSCEGSTSFLVTNDPLEVCPFARRGDVATPIRSITERPSLSPASSARHPLSVPCGRACLQAGGGMSGLPCLVSNDTNELIPAFYTGSPGCPCAPSLRVEQPTALPILAGACQRLWLVEYDGACGSSLGLDVSSSLSLRPP